MGEVAYALEQLEQAREHTERAIALARQLWGEGNRELGMCELLLARIALDRGEHATVHSLCAGMRRRMEEARALGSTECDFLPAEQALLELVELGAREGSEAEWDALEQRCRAIDLQPQEQLAVLESRAVAALRAGRRADAERVFRRAVALSEAQPNLWSERVLRRYAEHFAPGAHEQPLT
jgi:tetratricopeptide (TPR) repeat protein